MIGTTRINAGLYFIDSIKKAFSNARDSLTPDFVERGCRRRKRGRLGFKLIRTLQSERLLGKRPPEIYHTIFNNIADNERRIRTLKALKKKGFRGLVSSLLGSTAYIGPTLAMGIATATINLPAGFGVQVADSMRIDAGETFLDSLEDHGISLVNTDQMERALNTPVIMKAAYSRTRFSSGVELGIGAASIGVAFAVPHMEQAVRSVLPPEKIIDNVTQSIARMVPETHQLAVQKAVTKVAQTVGANLRPAFSTLGEQTLEMTGHAARYTVRSLERHSLKELLAHATSQEAESILYAQYGHAAAKVIEHIRDERQKEREDKQCARICQTNKPDPEVIRAMAGNPPPMMYGLF